MSNLFWLTDAQMERLRPFFPSPRGKPRVDDRRVLSGIIYVKKSGLQWKPVRPSQGLAPDRHPLRQMRRVIPLRHLHRRNRHVLVVSPDPKLQTH